MKRNTLLEVWAVSAAWALATQTAIAFEVEVQTEAKSRSEQFDRDVDQVALAAQDSAIAKLASLLKNYRGKRQEPVLLSKLAELEMQRASLLFRIAHGAAHRSKKKLDLTNYRSSMKKAITTLTELIAKYPHFDEVPRAYFLRAKANEEIEQIPAATRDYLHLVKNYPLTDDTIAAYMSLAEFSIRANDHAKAITYLNEVERAPESPHLPFALFKLAWAHYNLKNIPSALSYVEKHNQHYRSGSRSSDQALRENMLQDATVFYAEGIEQGLPQYQAANALEYFNKLDDGVVFDKMLTRFAKLLRSHGRDQDLLAWKDKVLSSKAERPASLDVLIVAYEHQLNRRRMNQLMESAEDMVALYSKHRSKNVGHEGFVKARQLLLDTAETFQEVLVKNKDADGVQELSRTVAAIYDAFTRIVEPSDPRIPGVHYNLAEALFQIRDFENSTNHYRWVVENFSNPKSRPETIRDAGVKAVAARYEHLRTLGLIPGEIKPSPVSADSSSADHPLQLKPLLSQWIDWVDAEMSQAPKSTENFYFEAARTLYSQGGIREAISRLDRFARRFPSSRYAVPAAKLALDTWIVSQDWERVRDVALDYGQKHGWADAAFPEQLLVIAADASYKLVEILAKNGHHLQAIEDANRFLKKFPKSDRSTDALLLAGASAGQVGEKDRAIQYLSRAIGSAQKDEDKKTALANRARLFEDQYRFGEASADYVEYLRLAKPTDSDALRRKALALAWISGDTAALRKLSADAEICAPRIATDCERYQALAMLGEAGSTTHPLAIDSLDSTTAKLAYKRGSTGESSDQAIWAVLALHGAKKLSYRERMVMLRQVGRYWPKLEPNIQFALIHPLSRTMAATFKLNRDTMQEIAPLRANPRYLQRRIEVIQEIENAATRVMKLPWSRIRATVLNEVAGLYLDLSKGIAQLPAPKDLSEEDLAAYDDTVRKIVIPFEEKGNEMQGKAFEIASEFAIETESFRSIADPYLKANPSLAKQITEKTAALAVAPFQSSRKSSELISIETLERLDPDGDWDDLEGLRQRWAQALARKHWAQQAFLIQEAKEKATFPSAAIGLMQAASLAAAGAQSEALLELASVRSDASPELKRELNRMLASSYSDSFSSEKSSEFSREVDDDATALVSSAN